MGIPRGASQCRTVSHLQSKARHLGSAHRATPLVPTSKPRVAVTLDAETYEQVQAIAKAERRSLSSLIETWVVAEVERRKKP